MSVIKVVTKDLTHVISIPVMRMENFLCCNNQNKSGTNHIVYGEH